MERGVVVNVANISSELVLEWSRWWDGQPAAGVGVLVEGLRSGKAPPAKKGRTGLRDQGEYYREIVAWLESKLADVCRVDPRLVTHERRLYGDVSANALATSTAPHYAAIAAVIRLHHTDGKLTVKQHGPTIRAAVRASDEQAIRDYKSLAARTKRPEGENHGNHDNVRELARTATRDATQRDDVDPPAAAVGGAGAIADAADGGADQGERHSVPSIGAQARSESESPSADPTARGPAGLPGDDEAVRSAARDPEVRAGEGQPDPVAVPDLAVEVDRRSDGTPARRAHGTAARPPAGDQRGGATASALEPDSERGLPPERAMSPRTHGAAAGGAVRVGTVADGDER